MQFNCSYSDLLPLHKIIPNPKNTNTHPQEQIDLLADIIDFNGQRSPIVISKRSGFVVKGHARLMAIEKLGWEKAAVDFQDYESEAHEYIDLEADNRIAELAERDNEKFQENIKSIDFSKAKIDLTKDMKLFGNNNLFLKKNDNEFKEFQKEFMPETRKNKIDDILQIVVDFNNENELEELYNELKERGYKLKIVS